jgi:hypothetical protein
MKNTKLIFGAILMVGFLLSTGVVKAVDDSTPPVIESFSITPTEFNTESGCIIDCYNASD